MDRDLEWVVASGERLRIGGATMGLRMTLAPPNLLCRRRFALRRVEGGFGIKYPATLRSPSGSDAGSNYSPRSGSDSDNLELIPTPPPPKRSGTSSKSSKSRTSAQVR